MITTTIAFQLAPRLARRIRPAVLIPAGIAFTVAGMIVVTQTTSTTVLVIAFAITCLGPAPLVTLGTNLVIGSVPPEKAGSAGALTQTSNEFGYSLGIAVLGSVVTVAYRSHMDGRGGNSLGEAITQGVPADVLAQAREAFTSGLHLAAGVTAVALTVVAVVLAVTLRSVPPLNRQ
jgi:DHA2 family multidrug resistance protein-like MFS transporter